MPFFFFFSDKVCTLIGNRQNIPIPSLYDMGRKNVLKQQKGEQEEDANLANTWAMSKKNKKQSKVLKL